MEKIYVACYKYHWKSVCFQHYDLSIELLITDTSLCPIKASTQTRFRVCGLSSSIGRDKREVPYWTLPLFISTKLSGVGHNKLKQRVLPDTLEATTRQISALEEQTKD